MNALRHSLATVKAPYDYRVAYFQRIGSGSDSGNFVLQSPQDLNPALESVSVDDAALSQYPFEYSVCCGWAPGSDLTGDRKLFGNAGWLCMAIYGGHWRPGGVNAWPQHAVEVPLVTGNVVKLTLTQTGHVTEDSDGRSGTVNYSQGPLPPNCKLCLYRNNASSSPSQYPGPGGRFFECTVRNEHPNYGFEANWICVMKDDEPYIYERVSGILVPKLGRSLGIGPKVSDRFNPMNWEEPS